MQRNCIENQIFIVESPHLVLVNAQRYLPLWSGGKAWKTLHNIAVGSDRDAPEESATAGGPCTGKCRPTWHRAGGPGAAALHGDRPQ